MVQREVSNLMKKRIVAVVLPIAALAFGCKGGSGGGSQSAGKTGEVIATVGDSTITSDEFKKKLDEQAAFLRGKYADPAKKKEFLDNMIRNELLLQEAKHRGLEDDPEVRASLSKVLVQKLIRTELDNAAKNPIPDDELKKYYDEHTSEFVKPERVRASHIFLAAPEGDPKRNQAKNEAAKLLAEIKAKEAGKNKDAFAELARSRSDDQASKAQGGDLGFKTEEELTRLWGEPFADAVSALKNLNDLGTVIVTPKGFHIIKLLGRQEKNEQSFEAAKARISGRLGMERRSKVLDDFVAELKGKAKVDIDEKALEKIEVSAAGAIDPARMPSPMPMPGNPSMPRSALPSSPAITPAPAAPAPSAPSAAHP
jgi:peptidyl-prolyl cis-trans isomerase C